MKRQLTNPVSDTPEDVADIAESIRSYMDNIREGIVDCTVKIRAEEERTDRLHRARLNRLYDELEALVDRHSTSKSELRELQRTQRLTLKQKEGLKLLRQFKA